MIYELRTYTTKQGTVQDVAKAASTVSREIRGDDYGKLEGYWVSDIGHLNQVMHLWSYADLNERARLRVELSKNPRWNKDYIPLIRPHLIRQEVRLLNAVIPPKAPATTPNVYELRAYRCKPGAVRQWAEMIAGVMPVREKYSKIVGLWVSEAGQPNEAVRI
jgi:NIPSNAP